VASSEMGTKIIVSWRLESLWTAWTVITPSRTSIRCEKAWW